MEKRILEPTARPEGAGGWGERWRRSDLLGDDADGGTGPTRAGQEFPSHWGRRELHDQERPEPAPRPS